MKNKKILIYLILNILILLFYLIIFKNIKFYDLIFLILLNTLIYVLYIKKYISLLIISCIVFIPNFISLIYHSNDRLNKITNICKEIKINQELIIKDKSNNIFSDNDRKNELIDIDIIKDKLDEQLIKYKYIGKFNMNNYIYCIVKVKNNIVINKELKILEDYDEN